MARNKQLKRTLEKHIYLLLDYSESMNSEMEYIERAVEMPDLNELIHKIEEELRSLCAKKVKSCRKDIKRILENSFLKNLLEDFVCIYRSQIDGQYRFIAFKGSSVPIRI